MVKLDMTGQACPIPVVEAKKALAAPGATSAEVLVDNFVAVQNLEKMAKGLGYSFSHTQQGDALYSVCLAKNGTAPAPALQQSAAPRPAAAKGEGPTVLISGATMGRGEDELGAILIKGYIFTLTELDPPPKAVLFLNGGAKLTSEGANTVPDLICLAEKGTEILTCGTCANFYDITEKLAVGSIVNMMDISQRLAEAAHLICL